MISSTSGWFVGNWFQVISIWLEGIDWIFSFIWRHFQLLKASNPFFYKVPWSYDLFKEQLAILIENSLNTQIDTQFFSQRLYVDLDLPIGIFIGRTNLFGQGKPSKKQVLNVRCMPLLWFCIGKKILANFYLKYHFQW